MGQGIREAFIESGWDSKDKKEFTSGIGLGSKWRRGHSRIHKTAWHVPGERQAGLASGTEEAGGGVGPV